jgi:hypothetical protein
MRFPFPHIRTIVRITNDSELDERARHPIHCPIGLPDHVEWAPRTPRRLLVVHPRPDHELLAAVFPVGPPIVSMLRVCAQVVELCVAPNIRNPLSRLAVALDRYEEFLAVEAGDADTLVGVL